MTFTTTEVCGAAGIKPTALRTWLARGFLTVEKEHAREWTRYSVHDAVRIAVLAELTHGAIELRVAAAAVSRLSDAVIDEGRPLVLRSGNVLVLVDVDSVSQSVRHTLTAS